MAIVDNTNKGSTGIDNASLGHTGPAASATTGANTQPQQQATQAQQTLNSMFSSIGAQQQERSQVTNYLTFGREDGLPTYRTGEGTEYTKGIKETLEKIYKTTPGFTDYDLSVYALDKTLTYDLTISATEIVPLNLAYSYIVVSLTVSGKAWYFIVLLEATGRRPLKAEEIMRAYEDILRNANNNNKHNIYTADDTISYYVHALIKQVIGKDKGIKEASSIISVDGLVLPSEHIEFAKLANTIAQIAADSVFTEAVLQGGLVSKGIAPTADLSIPKAIEVYGKANGAYNFRYEAYISKQSKKNKLGRPMRCDWILNLVNTRNLSNIKDVYNVQNAREVINTVGGYIEALPEEVLVNENNVPVTKVTFRPNIIITDNEGCTKSTIGFNLLGLMSALVMAREEMYLKVLRPDSDINVGALNIYSKIIPDGKKFDLSNKKMPADEVYMFIKKLFTLSPVISMDVEVYGPESSAQEVFVKACQPFGSDQRVALAAKEIIDRAHILTGGIFPKEYPITEIFTNNGVVIPMGSYVDKDGEKDIREIDLTYLATKTSDFGVLNSWVFSNLPSNVSGSDNFITKVGIINSLIPEADITGKAVRVTFSYKFLELLANSIAQAGLRPSYDPEVRLQAQSNLSIMNSYYANAGLSSNFGGFGTQDVTRGPAFSTGYGTMGNWR